MSGEEAYEWLTGKRSNINTFIDSTDSRGSDLAMCAIADAADTWRALAIAQAHKAGIVPNEVPLHEKADS